jgi:hypothetical protein
MDCVNGDDDLLHEQPDDARLLDREKLVPQL